MIPHTVALPPRSQQRADVRASIELGGKPLPSSVRGRAEALFSQDMSDVRVHQDARTERLNRALDARAATVGRHVFMPPSVSHHSEDGRRLYFHELAHVADNPIRKVELSQAQRAPVAQPTTALSPSEEELRGAMISLASVAGTYAQVRHGKRKVEDAEVTERLSGIRGVLGSAQDIVFENLPNPANAPKTHQSLRVQFQSAVDQIIGASVDTTGRPSNQVYWKHASELPEWAVPHVNNAAFSTPLPLDATVDTSALGVPSKAKLSVGPLSVVILPDKTLDPGRTIPNHPKSSGETGFKFAGRPGYTYKTDPKGVITSLSWSTPFTPQVTISTVYVASANPSNSMSAYGRGTTREDKATGNTTLRFHEGNHGFDFLAYISSNPYPALPNGVGLKPSDFSKALQEYDQAVTKYQKAMEAFSVGRTDCVGTKASFCH